MNILALDQQLQKMLDDGWTFAFYRDETFGGVEAVSTFVLSTFPEVRTKRRWGRGDTISGALVQLCCAKDITKGKQVHSG